MTEYVRHNIIDTNGLQRPVTVPISMTETLTLRDQFAMAALTGMLAANCDKYRAPMYAYEVADYMLGARKEKK